MSTRRSAVRRVLRTAGPLAAAAAILLTIGSSGVSAARHEEQRSVMEIRSVVHARSGQGNAGHGPGAKPTPNLTNHGGPILTSSRVTAIFWGTSWTATDAKVTGLDTFYSGIGGSAYMKTNTEYSSTNGTVGSGVTYDGHLIDTSAGPKQAPSTSTILAEVSKQINSPVANGYYPVYTDLPRGRAGYCAWHSVGTVHGVQVQFAFFFNLDGDSGCDPDDPGTIHSQGLEALANVSGHELSEAVTDPHLDAWYDKNGAENADKCAWTFSGTVTIGGQQWKVQGNWSNAAYNARSGYDGAGCIQTK
jgi:hypothetical protein